MKLINSKLILSFSAILFALAPLTQSGNTPQAAEEYIPISETLSLDQAISIALENNHQVRAGEFEHQEMRWEVNKAKSMMLPKISLDVGYTRLDAGTVRRGNVFTEVGRELVEQFAPDQDPNDIRPGAWDDMYSTSFSLTQPIYSGGRELANLSMSRALERSAYCSLLDTKGSTVLQVKETYFQVQKSHELVRLMEETLSSTREHLQTAEKMQKVGLRSRTDVLRWEVKEADDEGTLLDAANNLSISSRLLEEVLGVHLPGDIELVQMHDQPSEPDITMEEAMEEALRRHPTLHSLDAQVDAGQAGVGVAWSEFKPQVNLVYNLSWETNNTLQLDSFHYWSAGLTVKFPLFSSFGDWAELQRSKAQLNRLKEMKEGAKRSLETVVIQAYLEVKLSVKKWVAAKKGEEHATENLKSISKKYEVGFASNLDLIDAQVAYTQAGTNTINALYDHYTSIARLEKAMGLYENIQEGLK
jgi:outer membrane protein TolC